MNRGFPHQQEYSSIQSPYHGQPSSGMPASSFSQYGSPQQQQQQQPDPNMWGRDAHPRAHSNRHDSLPHHYASAPWSHQGLAFVASLQPDDGAVTQEQSARGRPFVHLQPAPDFGNAMMGGRFDGTSALPNDFFTNPKNAPASASYAHHIRNGIELSAAQIQAAYYSLGMVEKFFDLRSKLLADSRYRTDFARSHAFFSAAELDCILANSLTYSLRVLGSTSLN